ncbi:MAG TPA: hypothetical protein VGF79_00950 [Bacteroidia bacterium]
MNKTGIELISDERREQLEKHGWTLEHDSEHTNGELKLAALYALNPLQHKEITLYEGWG